MSRLEFMPEPKESGVRRIEVISGDGRRRRFSQSDKAQIVEETLAAGVSVSEIARRHGLTPQQVFAWRRAARCQSAEPKEPGFVPAAIITADDTPKAELSSPETAKTAATALPVTALPVLEIEVGSSHVWVWRDADIRLATALIRALKAEG